MNKAYQWVLNILVEVGCAIQLLDPTVVDIHFPTNHGLSRSQLASLLEQLLQVEDLVAERDDVDMEQEPIVLSLNRAEIEALLSSDGDDVSLFLTPQGGAHWETVASPDWGRYISNDTRGDQWLVASMDLALIEKYLARQDVQAHIVPGTLEWELVTPWQATYWKILPSAHCARFKYIEYIVNLTPEEAQYWEDPTDAAESLPWAEPAEDWYTANATLT
jgi:hypothetical protein